MILVLRKDARMEDLERLRGRLLWMGMQVTPHIQQDGRLSLAVVGGAGGEVLLEEFETLPMVETVMPFTRPFKLAGREFVKERLVVEVEGVRIGGDTLAVVAGPCALESEEQIHASAEAVAKAGANIFRGGAYKPRTSPYSFQGLGKEGLRYMKAAARASGLATCSEIMDVEHIEVMCEYVDILQVGARNMQNFSLLKKLGEAPLPILLKRGLSATYQELLMAAEYILNGGNHRVILCERGIRTFETYSRNTLDIAAVPVLKELSHLPVVVDPSHGTGIRRMVAPMARAAVAAGADGIMVEVHPDPDRSYSDAEQTLSPGMFAELMETVRVIGPAVGMEIPTGRES